MSPSPADVRVGLYEALQGLTDAIPGLNVYEFWSRAPTTPAIDIYPGTPFLENTSYGVNQAMFFTVRARASIADPEAGQRMLYDLLDFTGPTGVETVLLADGLGGLVGDQAVTIVDGSPTGFQTYDDGSGAELLGVEWRVEVLT